MVSNIIQAGVKVDICLIRQMEQERKTGIRAHIYKSQVTNVYEDGGLELYMPMEQGKFILLPIGVRLEFIFYAGGCLYRGLGLVEERYKSNNLYMLRASLKSRLYRHHRSDQHWIACAVGMEYFDITAAQAVEAGSGRAKPPGDADRTGAGGRQGVVTAMCGAGLRFVTDVENKVDSYILIRLLDRLVPACISARKAVPENEQGFAYCAEFVIRDRSLQEDLIRYIFDEERRQD